MSFRQKQAAAAIFLLLEANKTKKRKYWERNWIAKRKQDAGLYRELLCELEKGDQNAFKNIFRMSHSLFQVLLELVTPIIQKQDTHLRISIPAGEKLAVTLRFLATGDSYHSLMYLFRIPVCLIAIIIPQVCDAIYQVLKNKYLKVPNTEEEWRQHAAKFNRKCNFPNCIGSLGGKQIVMFAPPSSENIYYKNKDTHSIVLLALADANYKIIYMDVGCRGRISAGEVLNQCTLSNALAQNTLNIPLAQPLLDNGTPVPYVIVADGAFALKPYIMKPYSLRNLNEPQRIYNYRLSRARSVVENVFGIISVRFRILLKPIHLDERKTTKIVLAIGALHNFLMTEADNDYSSHIDFDREDANGDIIPGKWRSEVESELRPLNTQHNGNPPSGAKLIQNLFKEYFVSAEGEIPWQYGRI